MQKSPQSHHLRGTVYVMLSAVLFGMMPIVAKWTYQGGSNAVNLAFLRNMLPLPLLLFLAIRQQGTLRVRVSAIPFLLPAGILSTLTSLLLYASYNYIPGGMATTLHFVYPIVVAVGSGIFLKQRLRRVQSRGLILSMLGISLFAVNANAADFTGILLALLSGFCYAGYTLLSGTRHLKAIPCFVLSFYTSLIGTFTAGIYGLSSGMLTFHLAPTAWIGSIMIAFCITVGACVLYQVGIRLSGATNAAMFSLLEPITSVVTSALFFGEGFALSKIIGCLLILMSLLLIIVVPVRSLRAAEREEHSEIGGGRVIENLSLIGQLSAFDVRSRERGAIGKEEQ